MRSTRPAPSAASSVVLAFGLALSMASPAGLAQNADAPRAERPDGASPAALTAEERSSVVEEIAKHFETRYVSPEIGARYAQALRAASASGAYASLSDPAAFARRLTADLQAVAADRHVSVIPGGMARPMMRRMGGDGSSALEEARMLADGVAYLRFSFFPNDPATADAARAFLLANADASAVIIDARTNPGGGLLVMDRLLPLFYGETTTLMRSDLRETVAREMGTPPPTLVPQTAPPGIARTDHVVAPDDAETRLRDARVLYLTSGRTGSAAEHLAMALKHTSRGTVIGETTAGAGNPGLALPVGRFSVFVPFGRAYDPATGRGWEGSGVEPDVAVPAADALRRALELAGQPADEARRLAAEVDARSPPAVGS